MFSGHAAVVQSTDGRSINPYGCFTFATNPVVFEGTLFTRHWSQFRKGGLAGVYSIGRQNTRSICHRSDGLIEPEREREKETERKRERELAMIRNGSFGGVRTLHRSSTNYTANTHIDTIRYVQVTGTRPIA